MDKAFNQHLHATTNIDAKEFCFDWVLKNFTQLAEKLPLIISPTITFADDKKNYWKIFVKKGEDSLTHAVAFLMEGHYDTKNRSSLELMNTKKEVIFSKSVIPERDFGDETPVVVLIFNNNLLKNKEGNSIFDDTLILRFKVTYYYQISNEVTSVHEQERELPQLDSFEKLLGNDKFSDAQIIVGDNVFNVHKCILSARSEYFFAMFNNEMKENRENKVEVTDVNREVMQEVLRFIYAGKVNSIDALKKDLLIAADKYMIKELKILCEKALIKDLEIKNIVDNLILADSHDLKSLKTAAFSLFKVNKQKIMASSEFKSSMKTVSPSILVSLIEQLPV